MQREPGADQRAASPERGRRHPTPLLAAACVLLLAAAPKPAAVFAYAPDILLDFSRGIEVFAGFQRADLKDCSVGRNRCVAGGIVRVAWRGECILNKGQRFATGGIVSHVRDTYIETRHISAAQTAVLTTEGQPDAAYMIQDGGLVGVVHDPGRSGRLGAAIADRSLLAALKHRDARTPFGTVNRLLTLDPLGNCRSDAPLTPKV